MPLTIINAVVDDMDGSSLRISFRFFPLEDI